MFWVGEWPDMTVLADARQRMIATLDTFRHALEESWNLAAV
jgi:hypothetical protein